MGTTAMLVGRRWGRVRTEASAGAGGLRGARAQRPPACTCRAWSVAFTGTFTSGLSEKAAGYLCCIVACLGFGSSYIPIKKVEVRDGMFFSLCLSAGALVVGLIHWAAASFYRFEPFAMLGGAIWATGNVCVPFIIRRCGLGVGQLTWSATNMLTGWAIGTFGLLGKTRDAVAFPALNCLGVALAVLSLGLFSLLQSYDKACSGEKPSGGFAAGFLVALLAGVFLGSNFTPPTYLQQLGQADQAAGLPPSAWRHSPHATEYVVSHYVGIFVTTGAFFLAYCAASRRRFVDKRVVLPGIVSGAVWAIAQTCWFQANAALSYVVAFPIIVGVPGLIAALWGAVLFGENRGASNLAVLGLVVAVQALAVSLIAASRGS